MEVLIHTQNGNKYSHIKQKNIFTHKMEIDIQTKNNNKYSPKNVNLYSHTTPPSARQRPRPPAGVGEPKWGASASPSMQVF